MTTGRVEQPEDEPTIRRMDLAAAAAGIFATRKSLLRAGWSSWRTWEAVGLSDSASSQWTEPTRYLPGAGRRFSPMHGTRSRLTCVQSLRHGSGIVSWI